MSIAICATSCRRKIAGPVEERRSLARRGERESVFGKVDLVTRVGWPHRWKLPGSSRTSRDPRPLSQEEQTRVDSLSRAGASARRGSDFHARHRCRRSAAPHRPSTQRHPNCHRQAARLAMDKLLKRDPLRWLMRNSGNIDIHMIPADESAPPRANQSRNVWHARRGATLASHLVIAAVVTALSLSIFDYTGYWAVALFYLLAVVLAATRLRRWPTLFLAALSALLWDFLFIPPRFTFYISSFSRLHDVRRVFRDRARHRSPRYAIARARTIGAPPRRTRHRAVSFDARARRQPRSR